MKTSITRRGWLGSAASIAAGFAGLKTFEGRAFAQAVGFGPLQTDPANFLELPKGFKYNMISVVGDLMNDGFRVPGAHDGMAAFAAENGLTVLVRNHEQGAMAPGATGSPYVNAAQYNGMDKTNVYDAGTVNPASGGTTNIVYDTRTKALVSHHLSLTGTLTNCAGGLTPWGSWLTCEETNSRSGQTTGGTTLAKDHGWVFEVPATTTPGLTNPVPLRALGRFAHEALAIDPGTGIIYETEDRGDSAFYRYVPSVGPNTAASLIGGKLQAMKILGHGNLNTNNRSNPLMPKSVQFDVEWVDLTDIESPGDNLRAQARTKGCAAFSRGEGAWWGNGAVYFVSTDGGPTSLGQIFKYTPSPFEGTASEVNSPGKIELLLQPTSANEFAAPDNICIAPNGDVIICEDGSGDEFVHGVTSAGSVYKIARNPRDGSEFAGACFSPDGSTLFVNIQSPGRTFAITGPWHRRLA